MYVRASERSVYNMTQKQRQREAGDTHIIKEQVNTIGTAFLQSGIQISDFLVVVGSIVPQTAKVLHLSITASKTHNPAALDLANLTNSRPHGSCCSSHNQSLSLFNWLTNLQQSIVGCCTVL